LDLCNRQLLHAQSITFLHPVTNHTLTFVSDIPKDFAEVLKILKK
jgi:23S rRNA-/tRNA-specific pseudouridylate synthase